MASGLKRGDRVQWRSDKGWRSGEVAAVFHDTGFVVVADWKRREFADVPAHCLERVVKRDDKGEPV